MNTRSKLTLLAISLLGCGGVTPAPKPPTFSQLECITTALIPYGVSDAEELARDLKDGKLSPSDVVDILSLGLDAQAEFKAAYAACTGKPLAVRKPEAMRAPPPAYGNKVL